MSKASEYSKKHQELFVQECRVKEALRSLERPYLVFGPESNPCATFKATTTGDFEMWTAGGYTKIYLATEALRLAEWILDTFGEKENNNESK